MKKHYEALDGLRGVAALGVLLMHAAEPLGITWLVPHGYLAVDFFFVLSGLVVAEAYEQRLANGGWTLGFVVVRARRLLPMIALGTGFGLLVALVKWKTTGAPSLAVALLAAPLGALLIPSNLPINREGALFGLNPPEWSLFYEAAINLAFSLVARLLTGSRLVAVVAVGAGAVCATTLLLPPEAQAGNTPAGWPSAFALVLFSFFAGVLLRRLKIRFTLPVGLAALALVAVAMIPRQIPAAAELVLLLLVLPAMVAAAMGAKGGALSNFAGRLSYPLYATHYPFVQMFSNFARRTHMNGAYLYGVLLVEAATCLVVAYLALRLIDEPVRRWLASRPATPRLAAAYPYLRMK